jgi:AcrR family transcriptional regulator
LRRRSRPLPKSARDDETRAARLQAILDAALEEFAEHGYAATRLDDVARRAGVAKGTLYLYVPSKQALFEALVHSAIAEPVHRIGARLLAADGTAATGSVPPEDALRELYGWVRREMLGTRRGEIARLVIAEGRRFPEIAAFYHREVIGRALGLVRRIAARAAAERGLRTEELVRFPQLAAAPVLVALVWSGLFERLEPLDVEAMFEAHLAMLGRAMRQGREIAPCDAP